MNMTTYKKRKFKKKNKNVNKAALIKYRLARKGLKLADVARELNVTKTAVYRSIYDLSKISRIDQWLEENLKEVG